jgi:hypothetical protein
MPESRVCAYCRSTGPLTREHLWPAGIIKRAGVNRSYFGKAEKYIDAELKIKDVCAACNNGPLSALDSYACALFDTQFFRQAVKRQTRNFVYDYPRLLRWLLKISFNVARANDSDGPVLAPLADYMLTGSTPPPANVQVRLELIYPSQNPIWTPGSEAMKEIPAATIRCARVWMPENPLPGTTLRMVALHSYYFWISITPPDVDITTLHDGLPGKLIAPNKNRLSLAAKRGMLELHEKWLSNPRANASMRALKARRDA